MLSSRLTSAAAVHAFALLLLGLGPHASIADQRPEPVTSVQDLAYGEVLFHFYQDDYLPALVRLSAAMSRNELSAHQGDAELLLGGLYLSYGQHRLAGQIFENILEQSVAPAVHDRAWYFLARIWYQRGYLADAESALLRVRNALPGELEAERQMLHAQVLMDQGRFEEALALLASWRRPRDEWVGYSRYNVGVALVRLNRIQEGAAVLEQLGAIEAENPELAALRDKANVALGYAWLQADRPTEAKPSLQRVRLSGPFSNKALLGVGWADAAQSDYEAALVPWLALSGRSLLDSAVQEALLAVPYAFAQLGAGKQAADHYVEAIDAFGGELSRLEQSIAAIREGELFRQLLDQSTADASGWYWRLERVPDSAESRYLFELIATHRFQEGLKNYRDLQYLQGNLERWLEDLSVFDDILDTRQRAYDERLPAIDRSVAQIDLDRVSARRMDLESRLMSAERSEDHVALGTPGEQALWRELEAMEQHLARLGDGPGARELVDKHRFLQGLLMWDLSRDYKARLWRERKTLRELDLELREAQRRYHQLDKVRAEWPDTFADLTARIDGLQPRVEGLLARVEAARGAQERYLQAMAVGTLETQRERVSTYRVQARFALASIYDRAAARGQTAESAVAAEGSR